MYEPDWTDLIDGAGRIRFCLHYNHVPGPRIPLRYGSAATVHCVDCGAWAQERTLGQRYERWSPEDSFEDNLREPDEL
jgi:hypothetical protein